MNNFRKARIAVFSSVHWNNSMVNISELYLEKYRLRWWKLTRKPNIYCLKYIATETKIYMHSAGISTGITCVSEKNFMLYVIQLAGGILLKKAKIFWSYIKHFCNLVSVTKCNEVFPGQRFETQIRIQTQIRLSRILTLAIKCFMITKISSMYTSRPFRGT